MKLKLKISLSTPSKITLVCLVGSTPDTAEVCVQQVKNLEFKNRGWWLEGQETGWRDKPASACLRAQGFLIMPVVELLWGQS